MVVLACVSTGKTFGQYAGVPWYIDPSGQTLKNPYRESGPNRPYQKPDTDGLPGEEFTFVRVMVNSQGSNYVAETGGYWTVNGGPRLGENQSGNLTVRLEDGENRIRYYNNDFYGLGYQDWYITPPMPDINPTTTISYDIQSVIPGSFPGGKVKVHAKETDTAPLTFEFATDSGFPAIYDLTILGPAPNYPRTVGGCVTSGITASCTVRLKSNTGNGGLYKATLNAYRIDSRGNKIIVAGEWVSIYDMHFGWERNERPVVQILDTTRERVARNGVISLSGTASDPDYGSSIISTGWLINGSVVATGTSAEVPVDSGENWVVFQATDAQGETDGSNTQVYVVVNHAPVVVISGGDRSLPDTDGDAGETVAVSATASDSDGRISSTEWLIDGAVVATGTSANLALDDGSTTVTFRATDDGRTADDSHSNGASSSTSVTITVAAANIPPSVSISGGDRSVSDTDGSAGEVVSISAVSSDSDGSVTSEEWLIDGSVVATGTSANLTLSDGTNSVTFRATDNSGDSSTATVTISVSAPNASPSVSISGGNRSITDTDGNAGETVAVSATATDSDGSVSSTEWLVGGAVVATGTSANLSLDDGATTVTFRATDGEGASSSTSVMITVAAANIPPSVSISGGDRSVSDTDGSAGEVVSISAVSSDSDGSVTSEEWLIDGSVVATGTSANLTLSDGTNSVTFRATDNSGDSSTATVTISVSAPNASPSVSISGGNRSITDTDGNAGETVAVSATATDSDGSVSSTEWLVGGAVVATGTSANLSLDDGATTVTFRATDGEGASSSTSVTIAVAAPSENAIPAVSISGGDRTVSDSNGTAGEIVSMSGTATDSDGSIASTEWLISGVVVATGVTANLSLVDGSNTVTFRATDNDGGSSSTSVNINVSVANELPTVAIAGGNRNIADSDGVTGETVSFSATATDADGSVSSTQWLVGGSVVATGATANLSLSDGSTSVTFKATDNAGGSASTDVTINVDAPPLQNIAPTVTILGGNRSILDADGSAGEVVSVSATAIDSDGNVTLSEWLVAGTVVATGTSANLNLDDGSTQVTFRAIDNDGEMASSTVSITVSPASTSNVAPAITVAWGSLNISDTDGRSGEAVTFSATATDSDGSISVTQWLVDGSIQATGTSATLSLSDGPNSVTFLARDNDGETQSATVTVNVSAPVLNTDPVVVISGGDRSISDTDGSAGESVFVSATATDSDGTVVKTEWLVNGAVVATGQTAQITLSDGSNAVRFRATDNSGGSASETVIITVSEPPPPNVAPIVTIALGNGSYIDAVDTDGGVYEVVSLSGTATDSDGSIATLEWSTTLYDKYEEKLVTLTAAGADAELRLPEGGHYQVVLKAIDDDGAQTLAEVFIRVLPPSSLYPPAVSLTYEGANPLPDSDGLPGEKISVTTQASDSDGPNGGVKKTTMFINEEVYRVTDLSDRDIAGIGGGWDLNLTDGENTIRYQATDKDGEIRSASVTITVEAPNQAPVVEITDGSRSVSDTDGLDGETVSLSAIATDSDGSVSSSEWLINDELVATGTSAELALNDGDTTITFRATDNEGADSSTSATITVLSNSPPEVTINGGDRVVEDSDGVSGELVTVSGTVSDLDGVIREMKWLVSGDVISDGPLAINSLNDGDTVVTLTATDNHGKSASTSVTISVSSPNVAPTVGILGGSRDVSDSDGVPGEVVVVSGSATDSDGSIASAQWLVGAEVISTGTAARIPLKDGTTQVTFRATDDDGETAETIVSITVSPPADSDEEFATDYNGIIAPSFLSENFNTISVFDMSKMKLRSCVRLTLNGEPYVLEGFQRYDMNFNLLSLDDLTFRLAKFRPFNVEGSLTQSGESPDCSGQFELSTNAYQDIIAVPSTSDSGNLKYTYYDLIMDLIDLDSLLFKLRNIEIIEQN